MYKYSIKRLLHLACLMVMGLFTAAVIATSVVDETTHSILVDTNISVGSTSTVSWSPLAGFEGLNYSHYKLGTQSPDGSWQYQNTTETFYDFVPTQTGVWCFKVRAWHNDAYGLYSQQQCTTVVDSVVDITTHVVSPPSHSYVDSTSTIAWSAVNGFEGLSYSHYKLGTQSPDGSWQYQNTTETFYSFVPTQTGVWCFRVRAWYNDAYGLYSQQQCTIVVDSVVDIATHKVYPPANSYIDSTSTITWSAVNGFEGLNYSHYKLGTQSPDGNWQYQNTTETFYDFVPTQTGVWCFKVRAWHNDAYGLYSQQQCTTVVDSLADKVTHTVQPPASSYIYSATPIHWNPKPEYLQVNFPRVKLGIQSPDGSWIYQNITDSYYNFIPDQIGTWCFIVRAWYNDNYGLYSNTECMDVSYSNNLFIHGDFDSGDISPWRKHEGFHIGHKQIINIDGDNKLRVTSPIFSQQNDDVIIDMQPYPIPEYPNMTQYEAFYNTCSSMPKLTNVGKFRCYKSEISIQPELSNYENTFLEGSVSWLAYQFTITKMFDQEDCMLGDPTRCHIIISQFHTSKEAPHLSPNISALISYGPSFDKNNINLKVFTKIDCSDPVIGATPDCANPKSACLKPGGKDEQGNEICLEPLKYYQNITLGSTSGLVEGQTYYMRMKITRSNGLNGALSAHLKTEGGLFSEIANVNGIQTHPELVPFYMLFGMYWGQLDPNILYPKGDLGNGMSITFDKLWYVSDQCHLPVEFMDQDMLNACLPQ